MIVARNLDQVPAPWRSGAVTIGNFDGVHRGHARLLERLREMAGQVGGPSVVFTFDPSPAHVLHPEQAAMPLTVVDWKIERFERLGVDVAIVFPPTRAFLEFTAREFFDGVIRQRLGARGLVEGPNFFFGHQRSGDVALLGQFCREAGIRLEVVEPLDAGGQVVSSTRIRRLVVEGAVEEAAGLLAHPHRVRGLVVHGAGRGRQLGFPTANLAWIETLLPGEGIYAGRAWVDGRAWPAAISVGGNPTFHEQALKVEIFLVGFQGDLYDRKLDVDFLARLRGVWRFDGAAALVEQLHRDVEATRSVCARYQDIPFSG